MPEFDQTFLQQAENDVKHLYNLYTNDRQETLLGSCAGFPFFNIEQAMPDFSVFGI
jgi:hypothetical protein